MPATPRDSTPAPSPNMATSVAALTGCAVLKAVAKACPKPKQHRRILKALSAVCDDLERTGSNLRMTDAEPHAQAKARVDTVTALRVMLKVQEANLRWEARQRRGRN